MNFFKSKNTEEITKIDTDENVDADSDESSDSSNNGGKNGRIYDPTLYEKMRYIGRKGKIKAITTAKETKTKAIKVGKDIKGAGKFVFADNYYPKYEPVEMGAVGHHKLFDGAGYRDMTWILKFLFIFYPPAILSLAPVYALYGAETLYGGYMAVKPRKLKKYEKGRPDSYRQTVLKKHAENHKAKTEVKKAKKVASKRIKQGETFDKQAIDDLIIKEVSNGTILDS